MDAVELGISNLISRIRLRIDRPAPDQLLKRPSSTHLASHLSMQVFGTGQDGQFASAEQGLRLSAEVTHIL